MFARLVYLNEAQTMVRAERDDGTSRVIDAADRDMWALFLGGAFGPAEPYQAKDNLQPTASPICAQMRVAMLGALAVTSGLDPNSATDDEILDFLKDAGRW